jgi:predicted nucleic acid-binding protein
MTFVNLPAGATIFLDANILVYHLTAHPTLGLACTDLVKRIELGTIHGFVSTHVLTEVAHRIMLIEAAQAFGWPLAGALKRLKQHPGLLGKLNGFRSALKQIANANIQILTIASALIDSAAAVSQQTGLLSNDALIVAVMQHHGLGNLASHDSAFDRVPGITRYAPL